MPSQPIDTGWGFDAVLDLIESDFHVASPTSSSAPPIDPHRAAKSGSGPGDMAPLETHCSPRLGDFSKLFDELGIAPPEPLAPASPVDSEGLISSDDAILNEQTGSSSSGELEEPASPLAEKTRKQLKQARKKAAQKARKDRKKTLEAVDVPEEPARDSEPVHPQRTRSNVGLKIRPATPSPLEVQPAGPQSQLPKRVPPFPQVPTTLVPADVSTQPFTSLVQPFTPSGAAFGHDLYDGYTHIPPVEQTYTRPSLHDGNSGNGHLPQMTSSVRVNHGLIPRTVQAANYSTIHEGNSTADRGTPCRYVVFRGEDFTLLGEQRGDKVYAVPPAVNYGGPSQHLVRPGHNSTMHTQMAGGKVFAVPAQNVVLPQKAIPAHAAVAPKGTILPQKPIPSQTPVQTQSTIPSHCTVHADRAHYQLLSPNRTAVDVTQPTLTPARGFRNLTIRPRTERHFHFMNQLLANFPEDSKWLVSPMQLCNEGTAPQGIHIFVDASNIMIGFRDILRRCGYQQFDMSFDILALLMQRRRPVAKRIYAGSQREAAPLPHVTKLVETSKAVGYENLVKEQVLIRRDDSARKKFFKDVERLGWTKATALHAAQGSGSDSETGRAPPTPPAAPKWVEQGVDEILHLKMCQSIIDTEVPTTMVLATGDGNAAEHSDGFLANVERALKKGWTVELVSWKQQMSAGYRNKKFRAKWGDRFKIIELDDYLESLIDTA